MIIAPFARNLLPAGTVLTAAARFQVGAPAANLWTTDFRARAICRGSVVIDATNNKVDAGGGVATLASATYNSVAEACVELARALTAGTGSIWYAYRREDSVERYRVAVQRASGTDTLLNATGANVAVSALRLVFGYRRQDRAAIATHIGDYPVLHAPYDSVLVDLGSAKLATASFVAYPELSPGAIPSVGRGTTSAASTTEDVLATPVDTDALAFLYASATEYRYVELRLRDPRRDDAPRVGAGYWWHGVALDTAALGLEWEAESYERELVLTYALSDDVLGHPHVADAIPGERFRVAFDSSPGMSPALARQVEELFADIGSGSYAFMVLDTTTEHIERETRLVYLESVPPLKRIATHTQAGRWRVEIQATTVRMR